MRDYQKPICYKNKWFNFLKKHLFINVFIVILFLVIVFSININTELFTGALNQQIPTDYKISNFVMPNIQVKVLYPMEEVGDLLEIQATDKDIPEEYVKELKWIVSLAEQEIYSSYGELMQYVPDIKGDYAVELFHNTKKEYTKIFSVKNSVKKVSSDEKESGVVVKERIDDPIMNLFNTLLDKKSEKIKSEGINIFSDEMKNKKLTAIKEKPEQEKLQSLKNFNKHESRTDKIKAINEIMKDIQINISNKEIIKDILKYAIEKNGDKDISEVFEKSDVKEILMKVNKVKDNDFYNQLSADRLQQLILTLDDSEIENLGFADKKAILVSDVKVDYEIKKPIKLPDGKIDKTVKLESIQIEKKDKLEIPAGVTLKDISGNIIKYIVIEAPAELQNQILSNSKDENVKKVFRLGGSDTEKIILDGGTATIKLDIGNIQNISNLKLKYYDPYIEQWINDLNVIFNIEKDGMIKITGISYLAKYVIVEGGYGQCTELNWDSSLSPEICPESGEQIKTWVKKINCEGERANEKITCIPVCKSNNWGYYLDPSTCPSNGKQTKKWNKIGDCKEDLVKPSDEEVNCNYSQNLSQCTENNWSYILVPATCPSSERQTRTWSKTGDCSGGVNKNLTEIISCVYVKPNKPPLAIVSSPKENTLYYVNEYIKFDASSSYDEDGDIYNYYWDFGNKSSQKTSVIEYYQYPVANEYIIKLIVKDNDGYTSETSRKISVVKKPQVIIKEEPNEISVKETKTEISESQKPIKTNSFKENIRILNKLPKIPVSTLDDDNDGLLNDIEKKIGTNIYSKDTDNDGNTDLIEIQNGYNPMKGQGALLFTDIDKDIANSQYIIKMMEKGLIKGYDDGSFRPYQGVRRAEALKVILEAFHIDLDPYSNVFSDVSSSDWFASYVSTAKNYGVSKGYPDGSFRAGDYVNRVEFLKILFEVAEIDIPDEKIKFNDTNKDVWFAKYLAFAYTNKIIDEEPYQNFEPTNKVTRGEMSRYMIRLITMINEQ